MLERTSWRGKVTTVALAVGGLVACVTSIAVAAGPSASALAPVHGAYAPRIDPANFVDRIDNRFFPLDPGTAFHYRGVAENGKTPQTDDVFVTHRTKTILGVNSTVVRDVVSTRGTPVEKTFDYYAQDRSGNVWYMGEDTWERHHGTFVKASDSWRAGVAGAKPGIVMPGAPRRGDAYRQEYDPGHALDQARVLGGGGPIRVPYRSFGETLLTVETSKLEPGVKELKWYVAGVGDVKEQTISGTHDRMQLVGVTH